LAAQRIDLKWRLSGLFLEIRFAARTPQYPPPTLHSCQWPVSTKQSNDRRSRHEISDLGRVIRRTEIRRVIQYGLARTFFALEGMTDPVLDGKSLPAYVSGRNA
jgi:hypothetical protein